MKLILIDGSSLLNTYFWATVPREYLIAKTPEERQFYSKRIMQTSEGVYTNGVYAMTKSLLKLIEKQQPTHMAVAWDITRDTFRKKLYKDYKAQRKETLPELKSQFLLMQDLLKAAGISQFMSTEYEADDYLGTLAKKFENQLPVFILTKDQDALQLVSDRTRLWLISKHENEWRKEYGIGDSTPDGAFEFTPLLVKEIYSLFPSQIIDQKALQGDSSDNIPGVHGVGIKATVPLLQEYGTIEALYEALEDELTFKATCKSLGIRTPLKALKKGKESAFLSKQLATIKTDIPDCRDLGLMEVKLNIQQDALQEYYRKLEFHSLLVSPKTRRPEFSSITTNPLQKQVQGSLF